MASLVQVRDCRRFETLGAFLQAVRRSSATGRLDPRLAPFTVAAVGSDEQSGAADPFGGFLVPSALIDADIGGGVEDPVAPFVFRPEMRTPQIRIPARVDKNHSSSVAGGLVMSRRPETTAIASSRVQVEQIVLEAKSLGGLAYSVEEIVDSTFLRDVLQRGFREERASHLLNERIRGTGVGEFLGVLNSPALITVPKEAAQAADTIVGANIVKMAARCFRYERAIWLANPDTISELASAHVTGTAGDRYLLTESADGFRLFGRPLFFTEFCSTLGDVGDLILANWGEYAEATLETRASESVHVRFVNHERAFKFWIRNDGAPLWTSTLTPRNGAATLAPFVVVAERA